MASFKEATLALIILCFTSAVKADLNTEVSNDMPQAPLRHLLQATCPATGSTCYTADGTTRYCCPGGYNCYSSGGLTCYSQSGTYPPSPSDAASNGFVAGSTPPAAAPASVPGSAVGVASTGSSCTSSAFPTTCSTADGSASYCCPKGSGCFSSNDFTCYIEGATGAYPSTPSNFDCSKIIEITVDDIQGLFSTGELSSRALIECYLQRIADFDNPATFKGEVAYATNAIIELNPTVLADADAKDAERAACAPSCNVSKIHGIPVLLKDNVAANGMNVTAGSYALLGAYHFPAFLTIQILNAGGIILGKAGLSEWANFRSDFSVSGWSGRGGQVNDPYVRYTIDSADNVTDPYTNIPSAVTPGVYFNVSDPTIVSGSSSGSAVGAAANLVTLTIGSETSGSILSPSQYNAVVGIKPTVGLVSRSGVVPLSVSQDTAGPICRTLADATYLLDVIAAPDATDPVTLSQVVPAGGYTQFLNKNGLQGKKIAIGPIGPYDGADATITAAYARAVDFMRSAGATVDILPDNFTLPGNDLDTGLLLWYDFKQNIATYLSEVTWAPGVTPKNNLADLIQFNLDNYLLEFQGGQCCRGQPAYGNFFQDIFDVAQNTSGFSDPTYIQYKANANETRVLIEQFFQTNGYDAITSLGDYIDNFARTQQPGVTVPLALSAAGYPLGIIFHGLSYTEGKLIEIAYAFEQGFGFGRPAPTYCNSASCS